MIRLLVVEDNMYQATQIVNYISQKNNNIKVYGMAYSGRDALNIIKSKEIDIILLDLKLLEMDGVKIIEEIEKNKIAKYEKSIIIISSYYNMLKDVYNSKYVYDYFFKPLNYEKMMESINNLIIEHQELLAEDIIKKVSSELEKLNFNFSYSGTKYLIDSIYQVYIMNELDSKNLSKKIYPIVAKKYKKITDTIYGDIKQAINSMYYDCDEKVLKKYFNYNIAIKPKPKEIIYTVLSKIHT